MTVATPEDAESPCKAQVHAPSRQLMFGLLAGGFSPPCCPAALISVALVLACQRTKGLLLSRAKPELNYEAGSSRLPQCQLSDTLNPGNRRRIQINARP